MIIRYVFKHIDQSGFVARLFSSKLCPAEYFRQEEQLAIDRMFCCSTQTSERVVENLSPCSVAQQPGVVITQWTGTDRQYWGVGTGPDCSHWGVGASSSARAQAAHTGVQYSNV
ncbi:hypothetical protein RRG08_006030 [Elysia crispata]|uniref:Uncharacterized protein n=1 Tax=Elysia crispata TaxID=231223 RepID=A0AAE1DZ89_9GAST|nr:hypothetical protein RRG08_006030 [Elysia crispata]